MTDTCAMPCKVRAAKRAPSMADYAQWFASRGGKARAKALTAKERKAIGKKGASARWSKGKTKRRTRA